MLYHIKELVQQIANTFLHNPNQFASGGILLMAIGAIGASLRQIPGKIWDWIKDQVTVTMTITDSEHAYMYFKLWLETQGVSKRTRNLDIYSRSYSEYKVVPAPGNHWMIYNGRILHVRFTRTEEKQLGKTQRAENIHISTLGRKQGIYRDMMSEVYNTFMKDQEKKPELHAWGTYAEWQEIHGYIPRPLESVILPDEDKNRLIKDIEEFRKSRDWYGQMGIPYRKGYLFYGPPGTGKTSLVTGLSSHFNSNVYVVKLSDMSDSTLREAVSLVQPNSFIVMEDIDTVTASQDRDKTEKDEKKTGVTLSGLLNVVDGVFSPSGAVFVMTTNHKDKLDPALIRPGRVDLQLHITYATDDQKHKMYRRFFATGGCPEEYLGQVMTMAELQQRLMEDRSNRRDYETNS